MLATLSLLSLPAVGQSVFKYRANDAGTITVTKYTGTGGAVTVPATIRNLPVTGIGAEAFGNCEQLTKVSIPSSVNRIGRAAFDGCRRLAGIYFNGDAPRIGPAAFNGCDDNATAYYLAGTRGWGPAFGGLVAMIWGTKVENVNSPKLTTPVKGQSEYLTAIGGLTASGDTESAYSPSVINYLQTVLGAYDAAWYPPREIEEGGSIVTVRVKVARSGNILSAVISKRSGIPALDQSVQRAFERVRSLNPFPEGSKDLERTFKIDFNLKAKREIEDSGIRNHTLQDQAAKPARPKSLAESRAAAKGVMPPGQKMAQEGGRRCNLASSLEAKASQFGNYDAMVIEAIRERWYDLLDACTFTRDRVGYVVVDLRLYSDGSARLIKESDNSVGPVWGGICRNSISSASPFKAWPEEMMQTIGRNYREVRFTFYYK